MALKQSSNKKYIAKFTGRTWNTREEAIKDNAEYKKNVHYRYIIKSGNFKRKYPVTNYVIPYIPEKYVKLTNAGSATGAEFSTNLLDSIAINAKRAGLDLETALGIANKESTLGNPTQDMENIAKISKSIRSNVDRAKKYAKDSGEKYKNVIYHDNGLIDRSEDEIVSFWHNPDPYLSAMSYSDKKAKSFREKTDMLIKGEAHADVQTKKILSQIKPMSVLEAAFRYYKSNPNRYNPGQSNYIQLVRQKGAELMSSPEIQSWMKNRKSLKGDY